MIKTYSRVDDIDSRVTGLSLTLLQWRVLFSVNKETSMEKIKDYSDEKDESKINTALDKLVSLSLLSEGGSKENLPVTKKEDSKLDTHSSDYVEISFEDIIEDFEEPPKEVEEASKVAEKSSKEVEETSKVAEESPKEVEEASKVAEESPKEVEEASKVAEELPPKEVEEASKEANESQRDVEESLKEIEESLKEVEGVPKEEESVSKNEAPEEGKNILVIDESIVTHKMTEMAFEAEDLNIISYSSKDDLNSESLTKDNPALILVDLELVSVLEEESVQSIISSKKIPILIFSVKSSLENSEKLESLGVKGFVHKPFKDDDLVSQVKKLIS